jgi:hypothetical protein
MTFRRNRVSGLLVVIFGLLRSLVTGLRRGLATAWRGLAEFILISGSYPSLTRDPGIAAYRQLEGHLHRSRCFRAATGSAVTAVSGEPQLQFSAFL